jgi:hypothetical protein
MIKEYFIEKDYVKFTIMRKGKEYLCFVDLEDFDKIKNYSWNISYRKNIDNFYITYSRYDGIIDNKVKRTTICLHSMIMNPNGIKNIAIDHIDQAETLDNRKSNLRISENKENTKSRKGRNKNNTTGYRNVCFSEGWYLVQLQVDGKNTLLGKFDNVEDARIFAEEMRKKYYGDFAGKS